MWLSLIIAAYNAEATLPGALESALSQWHEGAELIIVDDGSTDATTEIAAQAAATHAHVRFVSKPNGGTASALNVALTLATGEFVSRLDADDQLADGYFEAMHEFVAEHPDHDIYSHDLLRVEPDGRSHRIFDWDDVRSITLDDMLKRAVITGPGTLIRRESVERAGGYREDIYSEDYDLLLRVLADGARHIYNPLPLYRYYAGLAGQKTSSVITVCESDIRILTDLMASGVLDEAQIAIVNSTLKRLHKRILREPKHQKLVRQTEQFLAAADRIGGPRLAAVAKQAIRLVSWLTRPLRYFLAGEELP